MSDFDDPFKRRDTRSNLGKTERRESPREEVAAVVTATAGDCRLDVTGTVSLNGFFFEHAKEAEWADVDVELTLVMKMDGEEEHVPVRGKLVRPSHRDTGLLMRFDDLDFEAERALARYLDDKSIF